MDRSWSGKVALGVAWLAILGGMLVTGTSPLSPIFLGTVLMVIVWLGVVAVTRSAEIQDLTGRRALVPSLFAAVLVIGFVTSYLFG